MTPIDRTALRAAMADLAVDDAAVIPFVQTYGDRLAALVRTTLIGFGRRDLAADPDEVAGLVWAVGFVLADRAAAWQPDGALPWTWARAAIRSRIARDIGHARADVEVDEVDVASGGGGPSTTPTGEADLDLAVLAERHPLLALLARALDELGCTERQRDVHLQYRFQKALGDPSPAHTVGAELGLRPDNVRQIDHRVRGRIVALAGRDDRFAPLLALPWLGDVEAGATGRRDGEATDDVPASVAHGAGRVTAGPDQGDEHADGRPAASPDDPDGTMSRSAA